MPDIFLYPGEASPNDVRLRDTSGGTNAITVGVSASGLAGIVGVAGSANVQAGGLFATGNLGTVSVVFANPIPGLRIYYGGSVHDLLMVAEADAPSGMGGVLKIVKNGTQCAVYLVETTDPTASPVRIQTVNGIKAIKLA